jgi:hypothetical protein
MRRGTLLQRQIRRPAGQALTTDGAEILAPAVIDLTAEIPAGAPWGRRPNEEEIRMEKSNNQWLVPLITGLGFAVLLIISFIVSGQPKGADKGPVEVANWYRDHKDSAEIGSFIGVVAGGFLIFFGAYLRKVFEPGAGLMLSILPLIAVAIVAVGAAIDGMLIFVSAEAVNDIPAPEIQTIQAIWDNDFLPFLLGILVFNWSVGLAVLRSGALPKWLGWWGIVFGVVSLAGPIGFFGAPGAGLWVIFASIALAMRARSGSAPAQPVTA